MGVEELEDTDRPNTDMSVCGLQTSSSFRFSHRHFCSCSVCCSSVFGALIQDLDQSAAVSCCTPDAPPSYYTKYNTQAALTFFACRVLGVQIPAHRHHLDQEPVSSLADHVDHLSVAHLHHVLLVHLRKARHGSRAMSGWKIFKTQQLSQSAE